MPGEKVRAGFKARRALEDRAHYIARRAGVGGGFIDDIVAFPERIGILLPNAAQIGEFHGIPGMATKAVGASPYQAESETSMREAGASLADTDIIVMHCIGYTEAMRKVVKQAANRPVLVSRQLVAHAIDIVLA